jgi:glycyl-tRNA synthetase beta chain
VLKAADKAVQQKADAGGRGLDAAGQATPALLKKLAAGRRCVRASLPQWLKRAADGKAEALFLDSVVPARRWPTACRRRWTKPSPSCRSPRS